jgi:ParB family chromosome partitioning protein
MKRIGARSILAIVVVERDLAYQILALNTEKAPNLKDRSLECIRMVRALLDLGDDPESAYAIELEEPFYLTVGACYERRARFSGSAYQSILKKVETFLEAPLSEAIPTREARAARVLEVDDAVAELVKELKDAGFTSPYLKTFVVARLNPVRSPKASLDFDEAMDKMLANAEKFDVSKVEASQITASGGYGGGGD